MNRNNSLKNLYGLKYYKGSFQSGLTTWYNNLVDKTIEDLNVVDVAKMIRQNILKDVAINRAIELFLSEPFDGEMQDGDLLAMLVSYGPDIVNSRRASALISMIQKLENEFVDFDWADESSKKLFESNLNALKRMLAKKI